MNPDKTNTTTQGTLIKIPQGRGGILTKATESYGVSGLYTNNFTVCNIIVFIGKNKASLVHFDSRLLLEFDAVKAIAEKVNPEGIIIFHKENDKALILRRNVTQGLQHYLPIVKISYTPLETQYEGVILRIQRGEFTYTAVPLEEQPVNISCHPYEKNYVAITAIEQIIGKRAALTTNRLISRQLALYDGMCWVPPAKDEFLFDPDAAITQQELALFNNNQNMFEILDSLVVIVRKLSPNNRSEADLLSFKAHSFTMQWIEDYLNGFNTDSKEIFRKNMRALINKYMGHDQLTAQEKLYLKGVLQVLNENNYEVEQFSQDFEQRNPKEKASQIMQDMIFYCKVFAEHYKRRQSYSEYETTRVNILDEIAAQQSTVKHNLSEGNYSEALVLCLDSLKRAIIYCLPSSELFLEVFLNYSKALVGIGKHTNAIIFLNRVISYQKAYFQLANVSEAEQLLQSLSNPQASSSITPNSSLDTNLYDLKKERMGSLFGAKIDECYWYFGTRNKDVEPDNIQNNFFALSTEKLPTISVNCFTTFVEAKHAIEADFSISLNKGGPKKGFIFKISCAPGILQTIIAGKNKNELNKLSITIEGKFQRDSNGRLEETPTSNEKLKPR